MRSVCSTLLLILATVVFQTTAIPQHGVASTDLSGLVLEVSYMPAKPSRTSFNSSGTQSFWTPAVQRLPNWTTSPGAVDIQAVSFDSKLISQGKAQVTISIFCGSRFREKEDVVGTYTLIEGGEPVTAKELSRYGFVPPVMKLTREMNGIADVPAVVNLTQSIGATVQPLISTLPTFNIQFTNRSSKDAFAVLLHTQAGERMLVTGAATAKHGLPVMAANGTHEEKFWGDETRADGAIALYVDAVIFADGSYEGNAERAGEFLAREVGRRIAMEAVVRDLKADLQKSAGPDLQALIRRIDQESIEVPPETAADLVSRFPTGVKREEGYHRWIKAGIDFTKNDALKQLRAKAASDKQLSLAQLIEEITMMTDLYQTWSANIPK